MDAGIMLHRYCVMVNDEVYGDSLSRTAVGARSYLTDARHAAATGSKVYVASVTIESLGPIHRKPKPKATET